LYGHPYEHTARNTAITAAIPTPNPILEAIVAQTEEACFAQVEEEYGYNSSNPNSKPILCADSCTSRRGMFCMVIHTNILRGIQL
jgi:hypothetical protein